MTQDSVFSRSSNGGRQTWFARASWDGSILLEFSAVPGADHETRAQVTELFRTIVAPATEAAMTLAAELGTYGRAHVVMRVFGRGFTFTSLGGYAFDAPGAGALRPIQRWTGDDGRITDEIRESMRRELMRAGGLAVWEPDAA